MIRIVNPVPDFDTGMQAALADVKAHLAGKPFRDGAVIILPSGAWDVREPIVVDCDNVKLMGQGTHLNWRGANMTACVAFTPGERSRNHHSSMSDVIITDRTESGTGLRLLNCKFFHGWNLSAYSCKTYGISLEAEEGEGCTYNTIHLGHLYQCHVGMYFGGMGWVNDNTIIGGQIDAAAETVSADVSLANSAEANVFQGVAFEGGPQVCVDVNGHRNSFHGCRFESVPWQVSGQGPCIRVFGMENSFFGGLVSPHRNSVDGSAITIMESAGRTLLSGIRIPKENNLLDVSGNWFGQVFLNGNEVLEQLMCEDCDVC